MNSIQLNDIVLVFKITCASHASYLGTVGQVKRVIVNNKGQPYYVNVKLIDRSIAIDASNLRILDRKV